VLGESTLSTDTGAPVMPVQELVAWTDAQKASLVRAFGERWSAWLDRWFGAATGGHQAVASVDELRSLGGDERAVAQWQYSAATASGERPRGGGQGAEAVDACEEWLARHLFPDVRGRGVQAPIARTVAKDALDDWLSTLEAWLGVRPQAGARLDANEHRRSFAAQWSGCLLLSIPGPGGTWHLYLGQPLVRRLVGAVAGAARAAPTDRPRPELAPAILGRELSLRVSLTDASLNLGQLRDLRLGDLITLPHALNEPAVVSVEGGPAVGHAWLGRQHDRVAAEFVDPRVVPLASLALAHVAASTRPPSETDAFGNVIGDALAGAAGQKADNVPGPVSAAERLQILGYFDGGPGAGSNAALDYIASTPGGGFSESDYWNTPGQRGGAFADAVNGGDLTNAGMTGAMLYGKSGPVGPGGPYIDLPGVGTPTLPAVTVYANEPALTGTFAGDGVSGRASFLRGEAQATSALYASGAGDLRDTSPVAGFSDAELASMHASNVQRAQTLAAQSATLPCPAGNLVGCSAK